MAGAEQHFAVDWQPEQSDRPVVVRGYLTNTSPYTFDRIRLLVEALGPEGQIAGQRVVWAPGLSGRVGADLLRGADGARARLPRARVLLRSGGVRRPPPRVCSDRDGGPRG